ncbi:uncharacterized protein Dvar_82480 [Desulfosarcina variabilis str. Montpellier]|uniref:hypothetical protein n=1 Tax=Desulfosarcina variabilis TaxID=2300 RepID=UPI003AFA7785
MDIFAELLEDFNAMVWRYSAFGIKKCETPGCTQNAISGKKFCLKCIRANAEIKQIELFEEILKSLERIETALTQNSISMSPGQTKKINNEIETQQNVFIPSIEIPETKINVLNEKKTTIVKDLSKLAKQLNNFDKED